MKEFKRWLQVQKMKRLQKKLVKHCRIADKLSNELIHLRSKEYKDGYTETKISFNND